MAAAMLVGSASTALAVPIGSVSNSVIAVTGHHHGRAIGSVSNSVIAAAGHHGGGGVGSLSNSVIAAT